MNKKLVLQLTALFLIVQILGLYVASNLIEQNVQTTIVTDNPEDVQNAVALIVYILIFTGFFLLILKFVKGSGFFLKILEAFALFGTGFIVFETIFPDASITLALFLVIAQNIFRESLWMKNLSAVIAVAGVGALMGVSLGVFPVLMFMIVLSVYDIIAVFGTKHMVVMAKKIVKTRLAFTFSIPTKNHEFQLGTGDMVIPLMFASSVLKNSLTTLPYPVHFVMPFAVLLFSLIGLIWTLDFAQKKKIALPALPLQTLLMVIIWIFLNAIGF